MKILLIGSGGREHALAWKLAQSPRVTEVIVAPGNAGTATEPKCRNVDLGVDDLDGLLQLARDEGVHYTVVGPEAPLVAGIVDRFQAAGQRIFGPVAAAARLEGSKAFTKEFLARHRIPTAGFEVHTELEPALAHVRAVGAPIVIKADGLAAGKGVVVATSLAEAEAALQEMLSGQAFGAAGRRVVIEEFLDGEEATFIAMVDGRTILPMATSQDHKRVGDGDTGPNTGGMGACSPAPVITPAVQARILAEIVEPTVAGMAAEGQPFRGFLYAGLMVDAAGNPRLIEFNVRFGDPETQPVLMRLQSDFALLIDAAIDARLHECQAQWDPRPALGVVMASRPYPASPARGDEITGLDQVPDGVKVFHAGTARDGQGRLTGQGGRVLCVTALGENLREAQAAAYAGVARIRWEHAFFRSDIGARALSHDGPG